MRDPRVGAVCGRTHPLGVGPLVWYQVFDYAIGHWFQKVNLWCFEFVRVELFDYGLSVGTLYVKLKKYSCFSATTIAVNA